MVKVEISYRPETSKLISRARSDTFMLVYTSIPSTSTARMCIFPCIIFFSHALVVSVFLYVYENPLMGTGWGP